MKIVVLLLSVALVLGGCAKPPEESYSHPKTGRVNLATHISECGEIADRFGIINMSPVHQYPMEDMKDHFQREKVFRYCMRKKGYERDGSPAVVIDAQNTWIKVADSDLAAGETSLVTIGFSSAVGGLENDDLTVENGSLTKVRTADHGLTWTAIFTPVPGLEAPSNVIRMDNSGVIDAVSNPGIGMTVSNNYAIDSLRPTVAIDISEPALRNGVNSSIVTFVFSEAPLDFDKGDVQATNGSLDRLVRDDATHYHARFTADNDFLGKGSVTIDATKFTDLATNKNIAAKPDIVSINTLRRTIAAYHRGRP